MFSVIDGLMSMTLDIYIQREQQDPDTGVMKREFMYEKTVPCYARGIISQNGSRNYDKQTFDNRYTNEQFIEVRTEERLNPRQKVTNISDSDGNTIWYEINHPNNTPTVFEIMGTTPISDPFGRVLGYNTSLKRSENQQIGV